MADDQHDYKVLRWTAPTVSNVPSCEVLTQVFATIDGDEIMATALKRLERKGA